MLDVAISRTGGGAESTWHEGFKFRRERPKAVLDSLCSSVSGWAKRAITVGKQSLTDSDRTAIKRLSVGFDETVKALTNQILA